MTNFFARQVAADKNDLLRSMGALIGIAQGMLSDGELNDKEIFFLNEWLIKNESISLVWPGNIIHTRIKSVLEDGVVSEHERAYLIETLQKMIGADFDQLAQPTHVTELAFDDNSEVNFPEKTLYLLASLYLALELSVKHL